MYDSIAHYYDLTHADLTADVAYIQSLAQETGGPILELGCGTGRILLPLARMGYTVTGVDNSAAMLARAGHYVRQEAEAVQDRVRLVEADMTALAAAEVGEAYALAIVPYNTLLHLRPTQVIAVLRQIGRCLVPGGQLFIDLINPAVVAQTPDDRLLSLENAFVDPQTGEMVLQMASSWLGETEQVLHITWIYDATPPQGGGIRRTVAQFEYYYLYPHQLELMLRETGFQLAAILGDYDGAAYTEESDRLLLRAVRAED